MPLNLPAARPFPLVLPYSNALHSLGIGAIINRHALTLLPLHLCRDRKLCAWRRANKFAAIFRVPGSHTSRSRALHDDDRANL
eukprot:COSAG01_NODE_14819_length_1406_cov_3.107881_2_plen_83_part_00